MAEVVLKSVSRHFGGTMALHEVSLRADDGDFLVLLGPSGCGKTTLLRIIAGLLEPTGGRVVIGDRDVTALAPRARDVAMVFQSYALYPHLTVEQNLGFGLRARRSSRPERERRTREVAEQLGLSDLLRRRPRELSGGQRQRVALGRAIVRDPQVFLMDEPLSNLDAQLRVATRLELTALHRRLRTTFVYVTHDQVEAMTMGTRIAVLRSGHLEQVGTPTEIYDTPATTFVAGFVGSPPMNLLPARVESRSGQVCVHSAGVEIPLWAGDQEDRPVVLGIRPERLHPAGEGETGPQLRGEVLAIENLGSEEVAIVGLGGVNAAVRGPRPLGLVQGGRAALSVAAADVHLFDPASTRRLVWAAGPGPVDHASAPLPITAGSTPG
jgi:multiple sugar transport system ATP-binding protein